MADTLREGRGVLRRVPLLREEPRKAPGAMGDAFFLCAGKALEMAGDFPAEKYRRETELCGASQEVVGAIACSIGEMRKVVEAMACSRRSTARVNDVTARSI